MHKNLSFNLLEKINTSLKFFKAEMYYKSENSVYVN